MLLFQYFILVGCAWMLLMLHQSGKPFSFKLGLQGFNLLKHQCCAVMLWSKSSSQFHGRWIFYTQLEAFDYWWWEMNEIKIWICADPRASCNFCFLSAKAQKIEMDKLEKAKKERTKVAIQNQKRWRYRYRRVVCCPAEFHFNVQSSCALCWYCLVFPDSGLSSCMPFPKLHRSSCLPFL